MPKILKAACWLDQKSHTKMTLVSKEEQLTFLESKTNWQYAGGWKGGFLKSIKSLVQRKREDSEKSISQLGRKAFKAPRPFSLFAQNCEHHLTTSNLPGNSSQENGIQPKKSKMFSFNKIQKVRRTSSGLYSWKIYKQLRLNHCTLLLIFNLELCSEVRLWQKEGNCQISKCVQFNAACAT